MQRRSSLTARRWPPAHSAPSAPPHPSTSVAARLSCAASLETSTTFASTVAFCHHLKYTKFTRPQRVQQQLLLRCHRRPHLLQHHYLRLQQRRLLHQLRPLAACNALRDITAAPVSSLVCRAAQGLTQVAEVSRRVDSALPAPLATLRDYQAPSVQAPAPRALRAPLTRHRHYRFLAPNLRVRFQPH